MHDINTILDSSKLASIRKLFAKHYRVLPDACWQWAAKSVSNDGYGRFGVILEPMEPQVKHGAHRVSWVLHRGPIPDGSYVLHKCDNRLCVNPEHLFLGTAKDNHEDMMRKKRWSYTPPWVSSDTYRDILSSAESTEALALKHGMSRSNVTRIRLTHGKCEDASRRLRHH